jgi:hypothetical protein
VKGSLKSNIIFDDNYKTTKTERLTHMRFKTDIDKQNFNTSKRITTLGDDNTDNSSNRPISANNPIKSKFINDTFKKNPIEILDSSQTKNLNQLQKDKSQAKFQRVSAYLGSSGFTTAVCIDLNQKVSSNYGKITNTPIENVKNVMKMSEPKKYVKTFRHVCENGRVYYD